MCPQKKGVYADVQCIVDDKIYYVQEKGDVTGIMRCNLNGKKKEELFKFSGTCGWSYPGSLKIDENYIYILGECNGVYGLERIPLYGGKIEKVAEKTGGWFELSDDSIFFFDYSDYDDYDSYYIYKQDKALTGKAECITKAYCFGYSIYGVRKYPFYYTDGHLVVQGYNKKERKKITELWDLYGNWKWALWADIKVNYADDYYWVTEDGKVEATIKGSGVKKKWK